PPCKYGPGPPKVVIPKSSPEAGPSREVPLYPSRGGPIPCVGLRRRANASGPLSLR
ncbi:hypothetical protein T484DRAFT_1920554, partial [Baffinella frigidus]